MPTGGAAGVAGPVVVSTLIRACPTATDHQASAGFAGAW
jgi:hypothetical protein